jgi:hypothetical protein
VVGQVLRLHKGCKLVYNGSMPLPASLIASIVSAIIEAAVQDSPAGAAQYQVYSMTRTLPPEAKVGVMVPPAGDGRVVIGDQSLPLAPAVQFRSQQNLIVMPMTIEDTKNVVYLTDASGAVFRVWMLNPGEVLPPPPPN